MGRSLFFICRQGFARGEAVVAARPGGEPWLRHRLEKADMGGVTRTSGRPADPNSHPAHGLCSLGSQLEGHTSHCAAESVGRSRRGPSC